MQNKSQFIFFLPPLFFILLPPTQGDKRGSRTKKRKPRLDFRFLFYSLILTRGLSLRDNDLILTRDCPRVSPKDDSFLTVVKKLT